MFQIREEADFTIVRGRFVARRGLAATRRRLLTLCLPGDSVG